MLTNRKDERQLVYKLFKFANLAAQSWKLDLTDVYIKNDMDLLGACWDDGTIEIRMWYRNRKSKKNKRFKIKDLQETLAHELAHLKYFNHSKKHKELTKAILLWLKQNW